MTDLHTRLLAALDARLERARAATPFWRGVRALIGHALSDDERAFIAASDPATEIRRVEALRRVVERHAPMQESWTVPPKYETGTFGMRVTEPAREASWTVCSGCECWTNVGEGHKEWPCADVRDLAAGEGIEVGE